MDRSSSVMYARHVQFWTSLYQLRTLKEAFRGPLEHSGCGGSNGSISERTPDGREWHVGGAVTEEDARAIVAAVNFVRDLCSREEAT